MGNLHVILKWKENIGYPTIPSVMNLSSAVTYGHEYFICHTLMAMLGHVVFSVSQATPSLVVTVKSDVEVTLNSPLAPLIN